MRTVEPVIYLIINLINSKIYIGKTIHPKQRWSEHKSPKNKQYPIQHAIQKYGSHNFDFSILERHPSEDDLSEAEMWWIAYFKSLGAILYNITEGGDGLSGYKHTEQSKKIMSIKRNNLINEGWKQPKHTEKFKQQRSMDMAGHTINVGKTHSPDCKHCLQLKLRNIINNPSKNISDDTKLKMSVRKLGERNNNSIMTEDKVIELRQLAKSGIPNKELAIKFGISRSTVRDIIRRRIWKHVL